MRTKLFFAFFAVIIIALVSNLIFERFMVRDFEGYVAGTREDKLYWILASVEGSYIKGQWDTKSLHDTVHWAMMLGFDLKIEDGEGRNVITSVEVLKMLSPSMLRRMEGMADIKTAQGEYEPYPLFLGGTEIGSMHIRSINRTGVGYGKEAVFKRRGREFLIISFVIAGGGAAFLAVFFSLFLSRPLKRMKNAVESLALGDFSARVQIGSKRDEIGRLAESFNFMAEALQREEALRRHLTSNIAHELRTPLTIMKANVEGIIDGVVGNRDEGLESIRLEVEKLIRLVEGIEDITKAEASFFSQRENAGIELRDFIRGLVAKLSPLAAEKGLEIRILNGLPVTVFTDPEKLERIIQNILTNAIKNTETGGIRIDYSADRDIFSIEVRDTGIGIPEDKLSLVFRRFYHGDESKGLGLGLAIVRELVDAMGGRIELQSREGEGSVFRVWLPNEKIT
ncbi:MAG: HAMP domain-containing histidine kinase [Nitrospirae bacterium]|nr:HAMP domain-containing histidine kinase [Nitrospirota bacterium]